MILAVIGGIALGCGTLGSYVALRGRARSLADVLALTDGSRPEGGWPGSTGGAHSRTRSWRADRRLAGRLVRRFGASSWFQRLAPDLAVSRMSLEELVAQSVLGSLVGFIGVPLVFAAGEATGIHLPLVVPLWAAAVMGATGAAAPVVHLVTRARHERAIVRHGFGSFLDLVVLCLAGGMGIESALHAAAGVGRHAHGLQLSAALNVARDAGEPPWSAFDTLGRRIGMDELCELGAALRLAGREGARIKATLAAKAAAMRRRHLAAAEAQANRVTERLFLPGVLLLAGFLVFIGYPAVSRILTGL
ncbi:MAG TPA: type II secretion system F family protein [Acidimicrobiales bacterium]|nr:type II secretion system F family protein [Acidimicrobiales bacterium]